MALFWLSHASRSRLLKSSLSLLRNNSKSTIVISPTHAITNHTPNLNTFSPFHHWIPDLEDNLRFVSVARICTLPSGVRKKEEKETRNNNEISWIDIYLPRIARPYAKLARLDKPIGTWLLAWPCMWSITMAASPGQLPDLKMLTLFGCGALLLRGAGCTINDLLDRDIDTMVERTKLRPVASGILTPFQGLCFLGFQLLLGLGILLQLNNYSRILGASSLLLVFTYPLMKRLTFWDKEDDLKVGVKSTALRFGDSTKEWITGCGIACISGLALSGFSADIGWPYYAFLAAASGQLGWQIWTVNLSSRADCNRKFVSNKWFGAIVFSGILFGRLVQ